MLAALEALQTTKESNFSALNSADAEQSKADTKLLSLIRSQDWSRTIPPTLSEKLPLFMSYRGVGMIDTVLSTLLRNGTIKGIGNADYVLDMAGNVITSQGLAELAAFLNTEQLPTPVVLLLQLNRLQADIWSSPEIQKALARPALKAMSIVSNAAASIESRDAFLQMALDKSVTLLKVIWIAERDLDASGWRYVLRSASDLFNPLNAAMEDAVLLQHQRFYKAYGDLDEISRMLMSSRVKKE